MAEPMARLAEAMRKRGGRPRKVDRFVVYRPARSSPDSQIVAPGVRAVSWRDLSAMAFLLPKQAQKT